MHYRAFVGSEKAADPRVERVAVPGSDLGWRYQCRGKARELRGGELLNDMACAEYLAVGNEEDFAGLVFESLSCSKQGVQEFGATVGFDVAQVFARAGDIFRCGGRELRAKFLGIAAEVQEAERVIRV